MYDTRILAAGLATSIGVVALIGVVVASSGVAYAVPVAGVGGFTVEAEEIRGEGMYIYPGVEETSERDAQPVVVTELQRAEIRGLTITKEMDASPLPGLDGTMRVVIYSGKNQTVEAGQQMMKYSHLRAERARFSGQVIDEHNEEDPRDQFGIRAPGEPQEGKTINASGGEPGLVLEDAEVQVHYAASAWIDFSKLNLDVEYDAGEADDGGDAPGDAGAPSGDGKETTDEPGADGR